MATAVPGVGKRAGDGVGVGNKAGPGVEIELVPMAMGLNAILFIKHLSQILEYKTISIVDYVLNYKEPPSFFISRDMQGCR